MKKLFLPLALLLITWPILADKGINLVVRYKMPVAAYNQMQGYLYKQSGIPIWLESTNTDGLRFGGWTLQGTNGAKVEVDICASPFMHKILSGRVRPPLDWRTWLAAHPAVSNDYRLWTNNVDAIAIISTNEVDDVDLPATVIDQ